MQIVLSASDIVAHVVTVSFAIPYVRSIGALKMEVGNGKDVKMEPLHAMVAFQRVVSHGKG